MCKGTISECLNCPYPDCINNYVKKSYELSSEKYELHKNKTNELQKMKRQKAREAYNPEYSWLTKRHDWIYRCKKCSYMKTYRNY